MTAARPGAYKRAMPEQPGPSNRLAVLRGLRAHLQAEVLGQDEAVGALADALLAGELGHTAAGRPRSLLLLLGPTGTGKTSAVLAASRHLYGTDALARINAAEFSAAERVPLLLGSRAGDAGILGQQLARLRAAGGRILLIDEIEKAHPSVADYLLGIEEAAVTLASGETLDLSALHVIATSNVGSAGVIDLDGVARASVRRFVEQEAAAHFRPEVLARFTAVLVFHHLPREVQFRICRQLADRELAFQSAVLSRALGHRHAVTADEEAYRRLMGEGWHRRLGARPMRNVVERRLRGALVEARLRGTLARGVRATRITAAGPGGLRAAVARAPITL